MLVPTATLKRFGLSWVRHSIVRLSKTDNQNRDLWGCSRRGRRPPQRSKSFRGRPAGFRKRYVRGVEDAAPYGVTTPKLTVFFYGLSFFFLEPLNSFPEDHLRVIPIDIQALCGNQSDVGDAVKHLTELPDIGEALVGR